MSYSQNNEEEIIGQWFKKFGNASPGRLLEIGAYHPKDNSNTFALIAAGWSGVLVEPSPHSFLTLLDHYQNNPNVTLVNAAISMTAETFPFYDSVKPTGVSTLSEKHRQKWSKDVTYRKYWLHTMPLAALFATFGYDFDFVNIDVESNNLSLFSNLPFESLKKTKLICVEHDSHDSTMIRIAEANGFVVIGRNSENILFGR